MNIALIALPTPGEPLYPPLSLAYVASLLEQRHTIVRIYDLGLKPHADIEEIVPQLLSFRPQVIVLAGEESEAIASAVEALRPLYQSRVMTVLMSRTGVDALDATRNVQAWFDREYGLHPSHASATTIDQLPFPARHLLALESYDLRAIGGQLQTTLLVGALQRDGGFALREPVRIVAELRSISHEFGLRHFLISEVPLTIDRAWLIDLVTRLAEADLGIRWEALVANYGRLDADLAVRIANSGCESLCFQIDVASVFESQATRATVRQAVAIARKHGIFVRADVKLEPPYESAPQLIDVAATFNLNDVRFTVIPPYAASVGSGESELRLRERARQMYDQGRDRQRYIERFGQHLGGLLWKLRNSRGGGLLDDEQRLLI